MNQNSENLSVEQFYRTSALVWLALLSSQVIFLVVIFITKPEVFKFNFSQPILGENGAIALVFIAIGFMNVVLSFVARSFFVKKAITEQKIALVQTGMIVACALAETASIFGLVLAFAYSYQYFFILSIIGAIGILLQFPQRKHFIDASYQKTIKN